MSTATITEEQTDEQTEQQDETYTVDSVPGGVLKAMHKHAAAESGRYDLNCIHLEGNEMVTANGAVLAQVKLPQELGPEELYRFPKPSLRKRKPASLTRNNGELTVQQQDGSSARLETFRSVGDDGNWPRHYEEVIPSEKQGTQVTAQVKYLQQALELLDCAGYTDVRLTIPDEGRSPFRVDGVGEKEIDATIVISPIVDDE